MYMHVHACVLSCVRVLTVPWTVTLQSPLSMEFSRQESWRGLPFPTPGDLPDQGIEPMSLASPDQHFKKSIYQIKKKKSTDPFFFFLKERKKMHDKATCYVRRVDLRKGIRESVWAGSQPTVESVVFAFYSWGVNSWTVPMVLSATLFSVPGIIHKNAGSLKGKLGLLFVGDELGR